MVLVLALLSNNVQPIQNHYHGKHKGCGISLQLLFVLCFESYKLEGGSFDAVNMNTQQRLWNYVNLMHDYTDWKDFPITVPLEGTTCSTAFF